MVNLKKAAEIIIKECMAVKQGEKVLIITDSGLKNIGQVLFEEANKITSAKLLLISIGKTDGEEPPADVADEMLKYNVILMATTKSLSHTKARERACDKGARIASMPGINEDMLERTIDIDYKSLKERTEKIADLFDKGSEARVVSGDMELKFSIKNRKGYGRKSGIYNQKGYWGNLPSGEAFIAPVEGTANGSFVDYSGRKFYVENGFAVDIEDDVKELLLDVGDKNAFNIAEFGVGTNDKAKITGDILEDEKVLGTCHIAVGDNSGFGGKVSVGVHMDFIIEEPTIFIDEKKIMEKGKLL